MGWLYYYARRYDRAEHHLARAIEMNPTSEENFRILGLVQVMAGRVDEGVATLREATTMAGTGTLTTGTLAYALDRAGRRDEAESVRCALEARHATEYVSATSIATAYLASGETARALDWIERAHAERRGWVVYLKVNPILDPLRDTPRFQELVRKLSFPPR